MDDEMRTRLKKYGFQIALFFALTLSVLFGVMALFAFVEALLTTSYLFAIVPAVLLALFVGVALTTLLWLSE